MILWVRNPGWAQTASSSVSRGISWGHMGTQLGAWRRLEPPRQPHTDVQHMSRSGWKDYGGRGVGGWWGRLGLLLSPHGLLPSGVSLSTRPLSPAEELGLFTWQLASKIEAVKGLKAEVRGSHNLTDVPLCWSKQDTRSAQTAEEEIETPAPDEERGQVPTRMGEILVAFLADILCTNKVLVSKISKELLGFIKKETPKKWKQTFTGKKMRMAWKHKKKLTLIANRVKRLNGPKNKNLKVRQGQVLVGNI